MPVIEAHCASILVSHDHRHISQGRLFELQATPITASRIELLRAPRLRKLADRGGTEKQPSSPRGDPGGLYFR